MPPDKERGPGSSPDPDPIVIDATSCHTGGITGHGSPGVRQDGDCGCEDAPHPDLTPLAWRVRHGVDIIDLRERRRVTEVASLKRGERCIDLGPEWMAS